jgi:hypothetical protein
MELIRKPTSPRSCRSWNRNGAQFDRGEWYAMQGNRANKGNHVKAAAFDSQAMVDPKQDAV